MAVAIFSFFTGEKEYSPSVEDSFLIMADITQPQERVQRQVMETQEDAVAWFQRLMGSPFIQGGCGRTRFHGMARGEMARKLRCIHGNL